MLALADAASSRPSAASALIASGVRLLKADGLHELKNCRAWLNTHLRDFVNDILRSRAVREEGVFDVPAIDRLLREQDSGGASRYMTLLAAIDLALAQGILKKDPTPS